MVAIGIARKPRRWITVVLRAHLVTHWRASRVYQPAVLSKLREGVGEFKRQWTSRREVESAAQTLREREMARSQTPGAATNNGLDIRP